MSKVERQHLLTAEQMARFVTDGYLKLEDIVPKALNDTVYAEQQQYTGNGSRYWFESEKIRSVFELPRVKGAIQSLVGENPVYDHSFMHIVRAHHHEGQNYHADSIIDARPLAFDIQLFYFSHDAPKEMGPTLILPGSHLRRVSNMSISRYKNILGQQQMICKAGTIFIVHHGIWHCAQPNYTDRTRYVFKLRLRPGQEQRNLFNTDGHDSPEVRNIIYGSKFPWQGDESRIEHVQRAKLWRYVVGNNSVDLSFEGTLTRMGL